MKLLDLHTFFSQPRQQVSQSRNDFLVIRDSCLREYSCDLSIATPQITKGQVQAVKDIRNNAALEWKRYGN